MRQQSSRPDAEILDLTIPDRPQRDEITAEAIQFLPKAVNGNQPPATNGEKSG